jgi:hypothetical protein
LISCVDSPAYGNWKIYKLYIPRTLIASKGTKDEIVVKEGDIASLGRVVVLLGEPGIGKTELTKRLENSFGATRVAAGTFWRSADPSRYQATNGAPLIIDGLDEVAASSAEPPIDRILQSLGKLHNPNVIISCRAADWTGAANRHKFMQDYGIAPVPVQILPFNSEQAKTFLSGYDSRIAPDELLAAINSQDLNDLIGNPLTLKLLAEVWLQGAGLPDTKTELLDRATTLLLSEKNEAHDNSPQAQVSVERLRDAAGNIFAHLLLAGAVGIDSGNLQKVPEGFVPLAELSHVGPNDDVKTVSKTRLFRSEAEDQLTPVHRVIAEYLAARWLAKRLDAKFSERRLFRMMEVSGGVPSALRGLHAWLGYFSPAVCKRCIETDPYGLLRYGDTKNLSTQNARHLLAALTKLADDDPYFRSEDWGVRSVVGLARPELRAEIVALITSPNRHVQLSALILESLAGSPLTNEVVPELLALVRDASATYVERSEAAEAMAKSGVVIDWRELVQQLLAQNKHASSRLAVETMAVVGPEKFDAQFIGDALIALNGINESQRREARATGSDYLILKRISPELSQGVLDVISTSINSKPRPRHWNPGRGMTSAIERLLSSALDGPPIDPKRFWSWVSHLDGGTGYREEARKRIQNYLQANDDFRREVQRVVIYDTSIDGGPWMAIVHELQRSVGGLGISMEDATFFLREIAEVALPSSYQITLWGDLVRATRRPDRYNEDLKRTIENGVQRHPALAALFKEIMRPPERDYEAEQRKRQSDYERKRLDKFSRHQAGFGKGKDKILSGEHAGNLISLANGYLGRYSDLDNDTDPFGRLKEWVGEEIAVSATQGFVVAINTRNDLPDLEKICSVRAEGKHWTIEPVMLAGVAEVVRHGQSLEEIPESVVQAVLGIWWDMPEFNSTKLGEDIEKALEAVVFRDQQIAEYFVTTVIESQFASGKMHVFGLYRLVRDQQFLAFLPRLALKWLGDYPKASYNNQLELLQFLLQRNDQSELLVLVSERLAKLELLDEDCCRLWMAMAFCIAPSIFESESDSSDALPKEFIWAVKNIVLPDRTERGGLPLSVERYEAIVEAFASQWPSVGHPTGGWSGDQNPWDACEFVSYCINAIGSSSTAAATEALERLSVSVGDSSYAEQLKHVAYAQRRSRRDNEYTPPTFSEVAKILANAEPSNIDDLKAVILDHLADLQQYVRNADTRGWEAFWGNDRPKIENVCRDRLLDLLRPRLSGGIELFPELPMPDQNRVDIYATILGQGLPIEIKGQWHSEVWNASNTQLIEKYARDWRTDGRGVYLVLWFGNVTGKNLPRRSDGSALPVSPSELQQMLVEGLGEGERSRIDVVVFDVSKSQSKRNTS